MGKKPILLFSSLILTAALSNQLVAQAVSDAAVTEPTVEAVAEGPVETSTSSSAISTDSTDSTKTVTSSQTETVPLTTVASSKDETPVAESAPVVETIPAVETVPVTEAAPAMTSGAVTILHTNDIHGRIEEGKGVIGMAKLATIVNRYRAGGTTLLLDSGDAFQGMPISNSTKGADMAEIMNQIGYDAMAVGNHEFDFSLEQALKYKETLKFPLLSANTYVNGARLFQASTIIDKNPAVQGDEFVVIGVTTPETAAKTHPNNIKGVTFEDPISEVNKVIDEIESKAKAEGKTYNKYVVLGHLGVDATTPTTWQGTALAQALSTNAALKDKTVVVLDGHSHTALTATYGNVTYNQTGSYLNNIGKVTLESDKVLKAGLITAAETANTVADPTIAAKIAAIKAKYEAENATVVIDNNPVELNGERSNVRVQETNLGNIVADALLDYGQTGFANKTNLAVTNGGGLRATIAKDKPVTKGDIIAVLPFGNIISQITVTGQQIQDMFKTSLSAVQQKDATTGQPIIGRQGLPLLEANGAFLQIAGAKVYYDTNLEPEKRILGIQIFNPETGAYEALDLAKTYYLATNDFLAAGGDGYTMLGGAREEGPSMDVVFADYLKENSAALSNYSEINPNSRSIVIDSTKDTDGDGVLDFQELLNGTDPEKAELQAQPTPDGQGNNSGGENQDQDGVVGVSDMGGKVGSVGQRKVLPKTAVSSSPMTFLAGIFMMFATLIVGFSKKTSEED
ncbi:bifunctional metallophosphatase/5'-nucleotidase [Streptococcus sp. X16XC17]|uniref:5'-nucleotidase C-terminal domain-containing protein n=1 Tax=unclassified Streptococcus TaxID=2608887 RepID=UPI00069E88C2|nr:MULTISPECIES: 5'-nucleotidase C-terminal domain-containing protein [unclassified Streptococcus]TCD46231.1 bifunctional metallophosphatase/5'-nucleotidase [Streptococcus sp. X16XC17]